MENVKKKKMRTTERNRLIFYILMSAIPLLQFCLFYIYVKFNSVIISFQEYRLGDNGYIKDFVGLDNFKWAWNTFVSNGDMIWRSAIVFALNLVVVLGLALVFSYYLAKKYAWSGFYRMILFLPQIIPSIALALLYKYLTIDGWRAINEDLFGKTVVGLLDTGSNINTKFATLLVYNIWVGFGTNVVMLTSSMSGINQSVVESAQLDGVNSLQEFIHIYVPLIYPTVVTFVVICLSGFFTNDLKMFNFFSGSGGLGYPETFGYYFYRMTYKSDFMPNSESTVTYSQLSALGLLFTAILMVVILPCRKLMLKYGPSVD